MKKLILTIMVIGVLFFGIQSILISNDIKKQVKDYKECIQNQSDSRGYIVRSECSFSYEQLDKRANLEYTTVKKDLYLKK